MPARHNQQLTAEMVTNYNNRDLDLNVTYWADREAGLARKSFQENTWLVAFPDAQMETISSTAQGELVVTESIVTATHLGPLTLWVTEPVAATGASISFRLCNVGQWHDGKLVELRGYWNPASILAQLGVTDNIAWNEFA